MANAEVQTIKLSSPATQEFWEIAVLWEDAQMMALDKPSRLLTSPDRYDPNRPNLIKLLHQGIERGAPWARQRQLTYLSNVHRLDFETTGVMLFAKDKPTLIGLANQFGAEKPAKTYLGLAEGSPPADTFTVDAKLSPHPVRLGEMRVDEKNGKRSTTNFTVQESFDGYTLLKCHPLTGRTHQIRVHLRHSRLPLVGDTLYGGHPLLLSALKSGYRLKGNRVERPLLARAALHAEELTVLHPLTGAPVTITAPWPKDLTVAVKYLRRYASTGSAFTPE